MDTCCVCKKTHKEAYGDSELGFALVGRKLICDLCYQEIKGPAQRFLTEEELSKYV